MPKQKFTSKRERFLSVAQTRTNIILEKIRILGNCSNRSLYEYSKDEIDKIFPVRLSILLLKKEIEVD